MRVNLEVKIDLEFPATNSLFTLNSFSSAFLLPGLLAAMKLRGSWFVSIFKRNGTYSSWKTLLWSPNIDYLNRSKLTSSPLIICLEIERKKKYLEIFRSMGVQSTVTLSTNMHF